MRESNHRLLTENHFTASYSEFQKTVLYKRLNNKFAIKPYHERYSGIRKLSFMASYLFNVLSAITASSAVYFFIHPYLQNIIGSIAITIVMMAFLESAKRLTAASYLVNVFQFKKYPIGQCAILVSLILLSVFFSYKGGKKLIFKFADTVVKTDMDSYTAGTREEIAKIDKQIEAARKITYRGTTTRTSQLTIDKLTEQRQALQERVFELEDEIREDNKKTLQEHVDTTSEQAYVFSLFTIVFEFFFLLSLGYLEYYDFRSFGEFHKVGNSKGDHSELQLMTQLKEVKAYQEKQAEQLFKVSKVMTHQYHQMNAMLKQSTNTQQQEEDTTNKSNESNSTTTEISPAVPVQSIKTTTKANLELAIRKARGKISSAEYRLKNKIGKAETSEQNRAEAIQEVEQLTRQLDQWKLRKDQ